MCTNTHSDSDERLLVWWRWRLLMGDVSKLVSTTTESFICYETFEETLKYQIAED